MRTSVKYLLFLVFIIFALLVVITTPGVAAKRVYTLAADDDDDDDDDDDKKGAKDNGQPADDKADEKPVELKVVPTKPKQLDQFKDFTQEVLKETLNKICQDPDQAIVVFGVALSQCTINWNAGTIQVKGLARILDRLDVNVDLEVSVDPETKKKDYAVRLQLPSSFKISDAVVALKMTAIDKLAIRNPTITIVSSTKNSWGAPPGVTIYVEVAPGKDDGFGKFFTADTYFSAEVAISTANDISELGKAGNKEYTLTLTANNFNVGTSKVLCEKALVAISTGAPQFKADVDCKFKLDSGDLTAKLAVETKKPVAGDATSKRSFDISGSIIGPINNAFGVDGMTLEKAGVAAGFEGGLKSFTFNGEISFKGTNFALDGDVVKGEYSFSVSNTNLKDILGLLGQGSLRDKVPSFTLEEVKVTIQTAKPTAGASFKVSAKVQGQVSDFNIHAAAILELSKGKVSLTASLEKSFDIGPVTLRDPSISVVAQSSDAAYSFFLSGVTKVFDLDNLKTTVGFASVAGKNGFLINVQLGKTFSLGEIIKPLKGTIMDSLAFKDPEVQISSYPVAYIDNVKRTGVVLKATMVFAGTKQLEGVKVLIGDKAAELPLVLPFGGSLTGFDIRQLKIIAAIPFPVKTGSKVIEFLDPMSLAIGFQPPSFGLNLDLVVRIPKDNQPLQFRVSFTLDVVGATAVTETMNEWVAPFGLKGLVVRKLALDVGINYVQFAATGTPSRIGVAGYFEFPVVGKVEIATLADIVKNQYILYAYIERFGLQSLRELLGQLGANVPKQLLPDIDFRQIKVYVAPTGGNIGSITFEPGYNFEGQLWVFNKNFAEIKVVVNFAQGIIAYGRVSAVKIGPLDLSESYIDLAITPSKQHFYVFAKITIKVVFEIVRQELQIRIDSNQLYFKYENKIYAIEASANPKNPTDLTITGTIKFDVINDIIKGMTMAIREIGKGLDELAKLLEKLEKQKKKIESGIKSIPIPSNCGSVATLAYDSDDMTPVQDFSKFLAEMDSHLGLSEFRQTLAEEEEEAATLDADDIAEEALLEYEEEGLEMYSEDQAMTQGFWRRLRSAFRRAGRAISRAARSAGSAIKRTASKAGNAIKRTASKAGNGIKRTAIKAGNGIKRTAIKAGNGIKKGAIIAGKNIKTGAIKAGNGIKKGAIIAGKNIKKGAEIAAKELKKLCDKAINEVRKAKNKLAEVAAEATTVAAKYTKEASKYTSGFLKNGFFELQSISFTASLAKVKETGGLSVDVKIKVAGQQKTVGFNLKAMSKVKDLAKDIVKKIIKK